ncbi:MAG TPA: PAS domain-containing protein [Alphaproteobacteria bacterium]|nr:PAS domain-containing protein [Alphaproteobacteria bacterium]
MTQTPAFSPPIKSDVLRRLLAHWDRIRGLRAMPARVDFDPLDVRYALGFLSIIEVRRAPLRFYFRLDGTKQVELFGIDCTRRYLDEAMPRDHAAMAGDSYRDVVECRAPRYHARKIRFHERIIDYEVLILPFSEDGARVDQLMTGIVPDYA